MDYITAEINGNNIAYIDTGGENFPVVLIHGNSCSLRVFSKQIESLQKNFRVIALDLPGHGKSEQGVNPSETYTLKGYAKVVDGLARHLRLQKYAVVGYSMGGNIALQLSQFTDKLAGIAIVASAPIVHSEEAMNGYPPYEGNFSAYGEKLTKEQAAEYMNAVGFNVEDPRNAFMVEDAIATDKRTRQIMVAGVLAGMGEDETKIVKNLSIPLAMIQGEKDIAVNVDYVRGLEYSSLWKRKVFVLEGCKHSMIYHDAALVTPMLEDFLLSI